MICQYNFVLPVDPLPLIEMTRNLILENGGTVTGENPVYIVSMPSPFGQFNAVCKLLSDSEINISVTKKPELVSCDLIRDKLIFFIKEGVKMQVNGSRTKQGQKENSR
jgi:hypothetical protein